MIKSVLGGILFVLFVCLLLALALEGNMAGAVR